MVYCILQYKCRLVTIHGKSKAINYNVSKRISSMLTSIHTVSQKWGTLFLAITLTNVNDFQNSFIATKYVKLSTTPKMCCYTTL